MLIQWAPPPTWNRWLRGLLLGALLQTLALCSFSLVFFPDLGQAGLQEEHFLGTLLGRNLWTLVDSGFSVLFSLLWLTFLIASNQAIFRFHVRVICAFCFGLSLHIWTLLSRPEISESWYLFQRSATFRSFVGWLRTSLSRHSDWEVWQIAPLPIFFLWILGSLNLLLEASRFQKESKRLQRLKKKSLGRPIDLLDKRQSIAGVSLFSSLVSFVFLLTLSSGHFDFIRSQASPVRAPNVFVVAIDGLSEESPKPFLSDFIESSDFKVDLINGSDDPFVVWNEWMSCQLAVNTGLRSSLGRSRKELQSTIPSLAKTASKEGYTTLLVSDAAGSFLGTETQSFRYRRSPQLGLLELTQNSLLRSLPSLQAILLATNYQNTMPSVLLSSGAIYPTDLSTRMLELVDDRSEPGRPLFGMVLMSGSQSDGPFPFLGSASSERSSERFALKLDSALSQLSKGLEDRGFLSNSVFVILGLRPQIRAQGGTGKAVTNSLQSYSQRFRTIFAMKTSGLGRQFEADEMGGRLFRSIDLAPTLARRMLLKSFPSEACDGTSFLDPVDKPSRFPRDQMYSESSLSEPLTKDTKMEGPFSLWKSLESRGIDNNEFSFAPGVEEFLSQFRSRAWFEGNGILSFVKSDKGLARTIQGQDPLSGTLEKSFEEFLSKKGLKIDQIDSQHFFIQENSFP